MSRKFPNVNKTMIQRFYGLDVNPLSRRLWDYKYTNTPIYHLARHSDNLVY